MHAIRGYLGNDLQQRFLKPTQNSNKVGIMMKHHHKSLQVLIEIFNLLLVPLFARRESTSNEKLKEPFKMCCTHKLTLPPIIREGKDGRLLDDFSFVIGSCFIFR